MKRTLGLLAGLLIAVCAWAQPPAQLPESAPDVLVRSVTEEVLEIVRKDKDIQSGNTKKAIELVDAKVLPHFNFARMTALAMGKEWRQANPAQRQSLTDEFRTLLVRTYSKALTVYKKQTVDYRPLKMQPADTDVRVRTEIKQPGGKPIQLDYFLEKNAGWKVYDIEVAGISLVTNYRDSFAQEISAGGIDGLIKSLQAKNKSGETSDAKKQ
ncbi:MAG: ABC transporter substrate-binding protein [Rhodocyclaceae bacterium]|nr:ABC transporter substrate-binding protein [Rhodocyclaceae bacterium]